MAIKDIDPEVVNARDLHEKLWRTIIEDARQRQGTPAGQAVPIHLDTAMLALAWTVAEIVDVSDEELRRMELAGNFDRYLLGRTHHLEKNRGCRR